jgi:hypothetical protein
MRKLAAGAVILLGLLAALGAVRGGPYSSGPYSKATATYAAGGAAAEVTTARIWSRNTTFPNTSARDASYITATDTVGATVNSALAQSNVAQSVRYIDVYKGDPTNVQVAAAWDGYRLFTTGTTGEDNITWNASQHITFVWVSANGLTNGHKIDSAYLLINADAFGWTVGAGSYIAARLDTVSTDYRITVGSSVGHGASNDYARMGASWDEVDDSLNLAWSPTLDARNDWHDFGPRSDNVIGPGTYARGTCFRINVTDAVQQASDNGTLGRGLLFVIYSVGNTTNWGFSGGLNATFVGRTADGTGYGKGDPTFIAKATSRRGQRPWSGIRVPVAFQFDDAYNAQVGYFRALSDSGLIFSAAACSSNVYSHTWADSLYQLRPSNFYFINHTRAHQSLGALTAGQLAFNMNRTWFPQRLTGFPDTLAVVDYALAGGGGVDANAAVYCALVANGYRSMRSGGYDWNTTTQGAGFAHDTRLSWDGYVAKYQIHSYNSRFIFGASSNTAEATQAQIKENLTDYIDSYYTDYGKSALVLYSHWYTESTPYDWLSESNLRYFIGLTRQLNSCEIVNYRDLISQRLLGATVYTPAQVNTAARAGLVATADSAAIRKMSAKQDSVRLTDPTAYSNLLQIWVGPK